MALSQNYRSLVPKPPQNYTVGIGDHKLTTTDPNLALQFLGQQSQQPENNPNPMAEQLNEGKAKAAELVEQQKQIEGNPVPQEAHINGGPMPVRDQVSVPHEGQAQVGVLPALLGLSTMLGGKYANPAQAGADQIMGAIKQTHANYESAMQEADALSVQAGQKYHDQLTARNEAVKEQAANNGIDLGNAERSYKQRGALGAVKSAQVGVDTLNSGLSLIGQQHQNKDILATQAHTVKSALPDYLDMVSKAGKADLEGAQADHTAAQATTEIARAKQITTQTTDTHALAAGKVKAQGDVHNKTGAEIDALRQRTNESKQLLPGKIEGQKADINLKKAQADYYKSGGSRASGLASASDINAALKDINEGVKEKAVDLKTAWTEYNNAETGPGGRLKYIEQITKEFPKLTPAQLTARLNTDPVYQGMQTHSQQVVNDLHRIDAEFQQVKSGAAAGRERIMQSSKVPGARPQPVGAGTYGGATFTPHP